MAATTALSLLALTVGFDSSAIVTSLPTVAAALRGDALLGFWAGTAYLLAASVAVLLASAAAGRRGHLAASVLVFVVGAIVCATAPNIAQLVAGRTVQGLGAGAILSQSRNEHDIALGAWAIGAAVGPLIGGAIVQRTTWRWIFYAVFPPSAVGLGLSLAFPPTAVTTARPDRRPTLVSRLGILVLFAASATSFLIGLSWGGIDFAWPSAQTLVPLLLGFIGLVGTAIWTAFAGTKLVSGFSSVLNYVCAAVQGLVFFGHLYFVPFFFRAVKGYTPIQAGLVLLIALAPLVPCYAATATVVSRLGGAYRPFLWAGWFLIALSCGLTIVWALVPSPAVWAVTLVLLGIGNGATAAAHNAAALDLADDDDHNAVRATLLWARLFGGALAIASGATCFVNVAALKLSWQGVDTAIARDALAYLVITLSQSMTAVVGGYTFGFLGAFQVYLGIGGVAFLASFLIRRGDGRAGGSSRPSAKTAA